jgi:DNA-binding transcriptional MerR regulator
MENTRYSIKDLENFTNIKAHTIRIWEQRYKLLSPKRTDTNIRYYNEEDLKKILNINLMYSSGYKISSIASLSEKEIIENTKDIIRKKNTGNQKDINTFIIHILDFNGEGIRDLLEKKLAESSLETVYENIILPLLSKIGELWQVNSLEIIHEHYFSNIFRDFIINKTNELEDSTNSDKSSILFLHEEEEHEFSLLLYHYILKRNGFQCHYFGQRVPLANINMVIDQIQPKLVITTFTARLNNKDFERIKQFLNSIAQETSVLISGSQLQKLDLSGLNGVNQIMSIRELNDVLK